MNIQSEIREAPGGCGLRAAIESKVKEMEVGWVSIVGGLLLE